MTDNFDKYEAWVLWSMNVPLKFIDATNVWTRNSTFLTRIIDGACKTYEREWSKA